jgi:hypothetical protein
MLGAVLLLAVAQFAAADVYMHSPRGSNDRNCERNVNRRNGNRLFDSQNNAKGGYACPRPRVAAGTPVDKMYYTAGSKMVVEWTNQHGCGTNPMTSCEIVIQYACEDTMDPAKKYRGGAANIGAPRDGTPRDRNDAATDRIPENQQSGVANTVNTRRFGMHESPDFYDDCKARTRNKGLFTADQNVRNNKGARATRQNPNGNRRGLECPEERDYYPYWAPTPWRDVAVITSNPERCAYYKAESENIKGRTVQNGAKFKRPADTTGPIPAPAPAAGGRRLLNSNDEDSWAEADASTQVATTTGVKSPTVDCVDGSKSNARHNQLGNAKDTANPDAAIPHGINANRYIWTVPNHVQNDCVLRLRYNVSTMDYADWDNKGKPLTDAASNKRRRRRPAPAPPGTTVNPIVQDPYLPIDEAKEANGGTAQANKAFLSLAVNTNQYGRTFQDRSYVFSIKAKPAGVTGQVYNVGVRGKRGNIVQVYPAVEYDFVPNDLCLKKGDYVHFQWAGSDYNPRRNPNDAEGGGTAANLGDNEAQRCDRSNIVDQDTTPKMQYSMNRRRGIQKIGLTQADGGNKASPPVGFSYSAGAISKPFNELTKANYKGMFWDAAGNPDKAALMKMAYLNQKGCKSMAQLAQNRNEGRRDRDAQNCAKLNRVQDKNGVHTPYFDGGMVKMNKDGAFSYMSTRNHNFSNRNQVGFMCVGNNQCSAGKTCQDKVEAKRLSDLKSVSTLAELSAIQEHSAKQEMLTRKLGDAQDKLAAAQAEVEFLQQQAKQVE